MTAQQFSSGHDIACKCTNACRSILVRASGLLDSGDAGGLLAHPRIAGAIADSVPTFARKTPDLFSAPSRFRSAVRQENTGCFFLTLVVLFSV